MSTPLPRVTLAIGLALAGAGGVAIFVPDLVREDDASVTLRVTDADMNLNAAAIDQITAGLKNYTTGEGEKATFDETGNDTGVFEKTITLTSAGCPGANNDGTLCITAGDQIGVFYDDAAYGRSEVVYIVQSTSGTSNYVGTIEMTPGVLTPGNSVTIVVIDHDLNTNPASQQTTTVEVDNGTTSENETVTLTETGNDTGAFSGTLSTTDQACDPCTDDNGDMDVQHGDTLTASYTDADPSQTVTEITEVVDATVATIGVTGSWPWTLEACDGTPTVLFGDSESACDGGACLSTDANENNIPDMVETYPDATHVWYDKGLAGHQAANDYNGTTAGGNWREAVTEVIGGGTLGVIGLGAGTSYELQAPVLVGPGAIYTANEFDGYANVAFNGDFEICAVGDVAVFESTSGFPRWNFLATDNFTMKNIKLDAINMSLKKSSGTYKLQYINTWEGGGNDRCRGFRDWADNNQNTLLRDPESLRAQKDDGTALAGGGNWEDPVQNMIIYFKNTELYDCNHLGSVGGSSHVFYYEPHGCLFLADNFHWRGITSLEVFRQLCRVTIMQNGTISNMLDFENGTVQGSSIMDVHGTGVHLLRNMHFQQGIKRSGRNAWSLSPRARRADAGGGVPNQWPGSDAGWPDDDDIAGNDDFTGTHDCDSPSCPDLSTLVSAPSPATDEHPWTGFINYRPFWSSVTASDWRPDQRVLTMSTHTGYEAWETIEGATSGAKGLIWKIDGNDIYVFLNGSTEFAGGGESTIEDPAGGTGTMTSVATTTMAEIGQNQHMFPLLIENTIFEGRCITGPGTCATDHVMISYGTLPGSQSPTNPSANRWYRAVRDDDTDLYGSDGYDTEATAGDGWVERQITFCINCIIAGDLDDYQYDADVKWSFNDGDYGNVTVHDAPARAVGGDPGTSATAIRNSVFARVFFIDLGGTPDAPVALPAWWPTGTVQEVCEAMRDRHGNDPLVDEVSAADDDPLAGSDLGWWDEPGAETGHATINHWGFPNDVCDLIP